MKFTLLTFTLLFQFAAYGSDHIDGPLTTKQRVADLSDFFAYPTPNKPGYLSLILNTYPLVADSGHLTDKAVYSFYLRRAEVQGKVIATSSADEVAIECHAETSSNVSENHLITCTTNNGLKSSIRFNELNPSARGNDFALYVGRRSDPFFFDAQFATALSGRGKIVRSHAINIMSYTNVISIVVEVELKKLFPTNTPSLLAVATDVTTTTNRDQPLDRIGRPELTNVTLSANETDKNMLDDFNHQKPFLVAPAKQVVYKNQLLANLLFFDKVDGKKDWKAADSEVLAQILTDDFLVLDVSKPCDKDSFFEIESALIKGETHTTCGGRKPTDDIMDTLQTLYVAGFSGNKVGDGVDAPSKPISKDFPYLADPDTGAIAWLKRKAAVLALGLEGLFN